MYHVFYASAGCLPDSEPMEFPTLEQASVYVVEQHDEAAYAEEREGGDEAPILTGFEVMDTMGAPDPRPNSLYRWSIEPAG